jgi:hypothetical protein
VEALQVCAPGEDERSWARLKELFAREDGSVHFDDLEGMLPVDPRVVSVLTIIVTAITSHADRFHRMVEAAATTAAANETAAADAAGGAPLQSTPPMSRRGSVSRSGVGVAPPTPVQPPDPTDLAGLLLEALAPAPPGTYTEDPLAQGTSPDARSRRLSSLSFAAAPELGESAAEELAASPGPRPSAEAPEGEAAGPQAAGTASVPMETLQARRPCPPLRPPTSRHPLRRWRPNPTPTPNQALEAQP